MFEKIEVATKNGKSRDTGNNRHKTQNEDQKHKTKHTRQKAKMMRKTNPTRNPVVNTSDRKK